MKETLRAMALGLLISGGVAGGIVGLAAALPDLSQDAGLEQMVERSAHYFNNEDEVFTGHRLSEYLTTEKILGEIKDMVAANQQMGRETTLEDLNKTMIKTMNQLRYENGKPFTKQTLNNQELLQWLDQGINTFDNYLLNVLAENDYNATQLDALADQKFDEQEKAALLNRLRTVQAERQAEQSAARTK